MTDPSVEFEQPAKLQWTPAQRQPCRFCDYSGIYRSAYFIDLLHEHGLSQSRNLRIVATIGNTTYRLHHVSIHHRSLFFSTYC
jgi:hypothetical protein